jgi:hypothetical protein
MISADLARLRQSVFWWQGESARKISFFMTMTFVLIAAHAGTFVFLEGSKDLTSD